MYKKILIANRGEIAVRLARTCREMGIKTVAVYEPPDETSLHIRVADECVLLESPRGFNDQAALLELARVKGADAIHPGYGFLAENVEFVHACQTAAIAMIAPPLDVFELALNKIDTLKRAHAAGFTTVQHSNVCANSQDLTALRAEAERLGYPVVVKSCRGGRGRAEYFIRSSDSFQATVLRAQREAQSIYGENAVYLERVLSPAHQIGVQILADGFGAVVHLGEREGSLLLTGQKLIEESPAPSLNEAQRQELFATALALVRLFRLRGALTLEFLTDERGTLYFGEIKPRIQIEHPLTEMRSRLDLVREQIRLSAGEPLGMAQDDVRLQGWTIACRIHAQDPQQNFMPSPGRVRVRFPNGPETRTDTYVYSGCNVPAAYDPLIAKVTVWDRDRPLALKRLERALAELSFHGIATNVSWLQKALAHPDVQRGVYDTDTSINNKIHDDIALRDLAIATALAYTRRNDNARDAVPERFGGKWHRFARTLPE